VQTVKIGHKFPFLIPNNVLKLDKIHLAKLRLIYRNQYHKWKDI